MATQRKPRKALLQFAIAAVVTVVAGLVFLIGWVSIASQTATEAEKVKVAQDENARLKKQLERMKEQEREPNPFTTVKEVQAVTAIPPGKPITKAMVALVESAGAPTLGAYTRLSDVLGKSVAKRISAGSVLTQEILEPEDTAPGGIPSGFRAMAIQVDPIGGLNGALDAGARVDVLTTLSTEEVKMSKTLLQGVQVIAVGRGEAGKAPGEGITAPVTSVTLAVTPAQAELLALANSQGKFHLTLRNDQDPAKVSVSGVDLKRLVSGGSAPKPSPPRFKAPIGGEIPVNFSSDNLPQPPALSAPAKRAFTMEILKAGSAESKTFTPE